MDGAKPLVVVSGERPMPADFPTIVRAFEAALVVAGFAATTRHAYRRELVNFYVDWVALRGLDLVSCPRDEINLYVISLTPRGGKRAAAMRALKAFYSHLAGEHRVDNPTKTMRIPRERVKDAPHLSDHDRRALLRAAFGYERRRGWAILLALHTGARVSSLVAVKVTDVDLEAGRITFAKAKGNRPYAVPLSRPAAIACRHLLAAAEGELLIGIGGNRFRQWLDAATQTAGIDHVWPHLLRHDYSNRVAQAGDPEAWRRLMNHADLSQWARYVHADEERLRSVQPNA